MYLYRNPIQQGLTESEQTFESLCQERQAHIIRIAEIDQQLADLQAYINNARAIIAKDPNIGLADAGLSQVCKLALDRTQGWVTAPQVRHLLAQMGIDLTGGYTNPMAVLHATLKRVGESYIQVRISKGTYHSTKRSEVRTDQLGM